MCINASVRYGVSTHAPARGATNNTATISHYNTVSTHAPARGATTIPRHSRAAPRSFNPRAREGRDLEMEQTAEGLEVFQPTRPRGARPDHWCKVDQWGEVSTHAPARGATSLQLRPMRILLMFQPTRPRGARPDGLVV